MSERLHFVVNKADIEHVCEGMSAADTKEYVAELMNFHMSTGSFQMDPSQVILVSARDAFLARMVLRGQPEPSLRTLFMNIAFGRRSHTKVTFSLGCDQ